ncbi:helix-turn-helix transcriptional regulator [Allomesorhizobium camelthorni]|uniref:WYL domain-containing protein n=1 Tax=Allomesorhizobium camelthorni TaxID=475069 RepID=A0A6G4WMF5_9HYPH|nr:WYL domain-containing protein [Mesorhizobium camelthorni]NGO55814.1 WYL domain-containing protein [Mesorhizobium camelthorni]
MQQDGDRLRWGVLRRLEFIDFRLFWDGRFNRSDLAETFGISTQQASADIAQYEKIAPANLAYDRADKAYKRTVQFVPAFIGKTIERYLLQIVAVENRWMRHEDTWFEAIPPVEVVTLGRRSTDPTVLLRVLDAVRNRLEIDVEYASLTGSIRQSRTIAPHAIAHSAGRWYLRSWSREHNDFRDYNLSRINEVSEWRRSTVDPALDFEWIHKINLVIVPNPELSPERQAAIAAEYAMENGNLVRPCRLSLSFYLMTQHNLDVEPGKLKPEKQQIVLQNMEEVFQAKAAARQMSIEALARAKGNQG